MSIVSVRQVRFFLHVMDLLKNPVPGRCPHLPSDAAHVDMCRAQELDLQFGHRLKYTFSRTVERRTKSRA